MHSNRDCVLLDVQRAWSPFKSPQVRCHRSEPHSDRKFEPKHYKICTPDILDELILEEQPHLACPERYRRIHPSVICQFRAAVPCSKRSDLLFVATRCTAWPGLWVVAMLPTRLNCLSRNKLHSRVLTVACRDQASCGAM
jgi:hypothetical protein